MTGTENGLFEMLGQWFLLFSFFIIIGVAIKVLAGGSSGSGPTRHKQMENTSADIHNRGTPDQKNTQPLADEQKK